MSHGLAWQEVSSDKLCQRDGDGFRQEKSFGGREWRGPQASGVLQYIARAIEAGGVHTLTNLGAHQQSRLGRSRSRNRRNLLPAGADRHRLRDDAESNPTFVARHASVP